MSEATSPSLSDSISRHLTSARQRSPENILTTQNLQTVIQDILQENPHHEYQRRLISQQDIQEAQTLIPQEGDKSFTDMYVRDFSQEYWAARMLQAMLDIRNNQNQPRQRDGINRLESIVELRNSIMGFYLSEFMKAYGSNQLSAIQIDQQKNAVVQKMRREVPNVISNLQRIFGIQTSNFPSFSDSRGNDSPMKILENELSAMMDMCHYFRSIDEVKDVIVQPATGKEDVDGKVDCYVLVTYKNRRGAEQYAVQMKERHYYRRVDNEGNDIYTFAGTGKEFPLNKYGTGLYYNKKSNTGWYWRRRDYSRLGEEQECPDDIKEFLQVINGDKQIVHHGSNRPYFVLPLGIQPSDVVCYTAWWVKLSPSGGDNRRQL